MFIIIAGVVVFFAGVLVLTLGISAIVKLIQKEYKLNKAIKEMNGEDPYNALYESDNLYACVERDHLKDVIERENVARHEHGFLGRVKDFFSNEKKESSKLLKEIYSVKTQVIKQDATDPEINSLEKDINQQSLSKAKSAYRILKSQRGRELFQKNLLNKPRRAAHTSDQEEHVGETMNTAKHHRKNAYQFQVKTTRIQRLFEFFKDIGRPKQYQPTKRFKV
ncbi:MAG: hypothetical protein SFW07_06645 [Gammaproteobacteria bacterium]|nr:hypothetical protein [Gammaproteobacteria bacterium]